MVGSRLGIVDQSKRCCSIVKGFAMVCWCVDHCSRGCGITVGVAVGRRSWLGDAWGLVKPIGVLLCLVGWHNCWREVHSTAPLVWLLAFTVRLSAMLSLSLSGASSPKTANGLLHHVCCWWTGCKSWMFEGAMGSCNVVGIQVGVHAGGGAIVCALARVTLGDRPSVDRLGYGVVGEPGRSTLGDGMSVGTEFNVPWWKIG